jgi:hypothetical protein
MPSPAATDSRWRAIISDHQRSGLTHAEFCRRRGLSVNTFRKRLYGQKAIAPAIERNGTARLPATRFLPVSVRPASRDPHQSAEPAAAPPHNHTIGADSLVLILRGGRRVAVGVGFDPATLTRLIALLERQP